MVRRTFIFWATATALAGAAEAGVVTARWGVRGRIQHAGTLTYAASGAGTLMAFDLSALPDPSGAGKATVHRARLVFAGNGGESGYDLVPADAKGQPIGKPLELVGPYYRWFDATAAVRAWAGGSKKGFILIRRAPTFKRQDPYLEIAYEAAGAKPAAQPKQVTGLKAFARSGQVFLTFREPSSIDGGKDDVRWDDLVKALRTKQRGLGGFTPLGLRPDDSAGEVRYRVYRHDRPITAKTLGAATLLAEVTPGSRLNTRLVKVTVHGEHGGVSLTGGQTVLRLAVEPLKRLPAGVGLYVHTPGKKGKGYYAVVSAADGVENTADFSDANTAGPIDEKPAAPEPVLTYETIAPLTYRAGKETKKGKYYEQWYSYWAVPPQAPFPVRYDVVVGFCPDLMVKPAALDIVHCTEWQSTPAAPGWPYGKPPPMKGIHLAFSTEYPLCFYTGVNEALHTLRGLRQGRWVPQVQHRQEALIAWMKKHWPIDPQRIHVNMGVWGMMEMERPDLYAWVNGWCQPNFTQGFQCFNHARGAWGAPGVYRGRKGSENPFVRNDYAAHIADDPRAETPYLVHHSSTGAHNTEMGWPPFPKFFRAMMKAKRPFSASWGKHSWVWPATPVYRAVMGGQIAIRRDQSLPAFANCTLDDNPGNGDLASGDNAGQINGYLLWDPSTIADEADGWAMTVWVDASARLTDCTVDLTPRRCRKFKAKPGQAFKWTNTLLPAQASGATAPAAAGKPVQSGTAKADKYGLVTIDGLKLTKGEHRIAIKPGN